ncbi:MAG: hypothetical protein SFZ23_10495 [Planctomycetota bacterium]|nr:hypothetical protein [Planctomycetota bacterium]
MTNQTITLSEDAFDALFPLQANHLNPSAAWSNHEGRGCLFETYGEELDFVSAQDARRIWTLIESDTGQVRVVSGWRRVNRLGYLVSDVPLPSAVDVIVLIESADERSTEAPRSRNAIQEMLAQQHEIAVMYGVGDVQAIRPDLDHNQSWDVLRECRDHVTCEFGLNYYMIEIVAGILFPLLETRDDDDV